MGTSLKSKLIQMIRRILEKNVDQEVHDTAGREAGATVLTLAGWQRRLGINYKDSELAKRWRRARVASGG
jgi:hypothetical protein